MAGSIIGTFAAASGSTDLTSGSRTSVSGSLITWHCTAWRTAAPPNVTFGDNQGNAPITQTNVPNGSDRVAQGYNANGTRGAAHELTATFDNVFGCSFVGLEWSGIVASPTVASNTATGSSAAPSVSVDAGGVTSTFVGTVTYGGSPATITPNGATEGAEVDESSNNQALAAAYKTNLSGTQSIDWTLSGSRNWTAVAQSFEESQAAQSITPSGQGSASALGSQTIANAAVQSIAPGGKSSAVVLGSHTISITQNLILPAGKSSAAAYGGHTFSGTQQTISPTGVGSAGIFGTQSIANTVDTVAPAGQPSAAVYGSHITIKEIPSQGVPSAAVFGNNVLLGVEDKLITATGIGSSAAYGSATISSITALAIQPVGVAHPAAYGTQIVEGSILNISPPSIISGQRYGAHTLVGGAPQTDVQVEWRRTWMPAWEKAYGRVWDG
jgi:hypothetical protein